MHSTRRNPISLPPTPASALSHHAHFQTIFKPTTFFKYTHKHLPIPTNGSSVTVHAEFIFETNVGLLHEIFNSF